MARITKHDSNQAGIVAALRAAGASVCDLAGVGAGCPDLLIGWHGQNVLVEVKNPDGRGNRLTPAELSFISGWRGQVAIVTDPAGALDLLNSLFMRLCNGQNDPS